MGQQITLTEVQVRMLVLLIRDRYTIVQIEALPDGSPIVTCGTEYEDLEENGVQYTWNITCACWQLG
jgi:hypothetical protein